MKNRKAPRCHNCGEPYKAKHWSPSTFFVGDTFTGWDIDGHVCRIGIRYFIERTDTHLWWFKGGWTDDPMVAMIWVDKNKAEDYLKESLEIPPRLPCEVTEHEFLTPTQPK